MGKKCEVIVLVFELSLLMQNVNKVYQKRGFHKKYLSCFDKHFQKSNGTKNNFEKRYYLTKMFDSFLSSYEDDKLE